MMMTASSHALDWWDDVLPSLITRKGFRRDAVTKNAREDSIQIRAFHIANQTREKDNRKQWDKTLKSVDDVIWPAPGQPDQKGPLGNVHHLLPYIPPSCFLFMTGI